MQTTKRYTNQTFTKHVDDVKGSHRTPRSLPEPSICEVCGDVYRNRRWSMPEVKQQLATNQVVCPACQRQRSGVPSGYIYLQGSFLAEHRDEITHLLLNEARHSLEDNPLARIMEWETDSEGRITVTTTTEHLARRLGRSLGKAYHGKLRYGLSQRNKLARVWWQRD
jgi:hypothetical protein